MPESTSSRQRRSSTARKSSRGSQRPNRSQMRAMEVRRAESASAAAAPNVTAARAARSRPVARGVALSREAEMRYQRKDLRRLLYTAGVLLVLMLALLFIVD
jgi:hypothetical protein